MDEKEYFVNRYKKTFLKFMSAKRVSPCTKDFVHGRLSELREVIRELYPELQEEINKIEGK